MTISWQSVRSLRRPHAHKWLVTTWLDLCGPVSIYVDGEWRHGNLLEVHENDVVYSLCGDDDEFIISKDTARSIIRDRKIVANARRANTYTGSNPLFFGPDGASIYGKTIVEHKGRPNSYRVLIKYKPLQRGKVMNFKIALVKHVRFGCLLSVSVLLLHCLPIAG